MFQLPSMACATVLWHLGASVRRCVYVSSRHNRARSHVAMSLVFHSFSRQELFLKFGAIKTAQVHYNDSGVSTCTAHVTFKKRTSAVDAHEEYNGVALDGTCHTVACISTLLLLLCCHVVSIGMPTSDSCTVTCTHAQTIAHTHNPQTPHAKHNHAHAAPTGKPMRIEFITPELAAPAEAAQPRAAPQQAYVSPF